MTPTELQARIDALIITVQDAETAGAITGEMVGEILGHLNDSAKSLTSKTAESSQAIAGLQATINTVLGRNASTAIENFNEVIAFLAGLKDTETLAGKLADIASQLAAKVTKAEFAPISEHVAAIRAVDLVKTICEPTATASAVQIGFGYYEEGNYGSVVGDSITLTAATSTTAGVMTAADKVRLDSSATQTELHTLSNRLSQLTPIILTQAQYDSALAAGEISPSQHYAIVEEEQA